MNPTELNGKLWDADFDSVALWLAALPGTRGRSYDRYHADAGTNLQAAVRAFKNEKV